MIGTKYDDYDLTLLDCGHYLVQCGGVTHRARNRKAAMRWVIRQRQRNTIRGNTSAQHAVMSCTEIGKRLGMSKTRVEQIERSAMVKIKRALQDLEKEWFDNG